MINYKLKIDIMGKGDIKTKKGKRFNKSFGKHRLRKHSKNIKNIKKPPL